ncbi:MAG: hypothetical protein EBT09_11190 [Actinobacteria bacterium]|nr:hypothetical protein [Actinomycetota bacterium]
MWCDAQGTTDAEELAGHAQEPVNLCDSQATPSRPNGHPAAKSTGFEHVADGEPIRNASTRNAPTLRKRPGHPGPQQLLIPVGVEAATRPADHERAQADEQHHEGVGERVFRHGCGRTGLQVGFRLSVILLP